MYSNGEVSFGTKQYHDDGQVSINGVRQEATSAPAFFLNGEEAAQHLRFLAKIKYEAIQMIGEEAARCAGNATHLERTIKGQ